MKNILKASKFVLGIFALIITCACTAVANESTELTHYIIDSSQDGSPLVAVASGAKTTLLSALGSVGASLASIPLFFVDGSFKELADRDWETIM